MTEYEYHVAILDTSPDPLEQNLNARAKAGWRLVSLEAVARERVRGVFERPIDKTKPQNNKTKSMQHGNRKQATKGTAGS